MHDTTLGMSRYRAGQFRQALVDRDIEPSDETLRRVHRFDSALRSIALALTEQVELALRGRVDEAATRRHGPRWYLHPQAFRRGFDHSAMVRQAAAALDRSHDPVVQRVWSTKRFERITFGMLAEELSLDMLARLTGGLEPGPHDDVAATFRLPPPTLRPCLQHLTHVRNCCAHHTRLWGRSLRVPPPTFRSPPDLVRRLASVPKGSPAHSLELLAHLAETVGPCDGHVAAVRRVFDGNDDLVTGIGGCPTWAVG